MKDMSFEEVNLLRQRLSSEWHPTLNKEYIFADIPLQSNKKFWWVCSLGHEWQAIVFSRFKGSNCPVCANKTILSGFNDLATLFPAIAAEFHPEKNGSLSPTSLGAGSSKRLWWLCAEGHEWEAEVYVRANRGSLCPVCSHRKLLPGFNDLTTTHPRLTAEWHSTKNSLTPDSLMGNSTTKVWWMCRKGHEWLAAVVNRTRDGSGCHVCASKTVVAGVNDLGSNHPLVAHYWDHEKNGDLSPEQVTSRSNKIVWWLCDKNHSYQKVVGSQVDSPTCPFCSRRKTVTGENDLTTTHPHLAAEWHPTRNGDLRPYDVTSKNAVKIWWMDVAGHEWESIVCDRVKGSGCHYCNNFRVLKGFNDLATTHPHLAEQWSTNNVIQPSEVTFGSQQVVEWKDSLGHEWSSSIGGRIKYGCPVCSGNKVLPGFNDVATVSSAVAAEWHPTKNDNLTAADFTSGSHTYVWWLCSKGHEWNAHIGSRVKGAGCPVCNANSFISKGEQEINDYITSLGFVTVQSDRKTVAKNELDIYIPDKKVAVEYNGLYWHSDKIKTSPTYHYDKWLACQKQGIQLIQVWEDEWVKRPDIVKSFMAHKLGVSGTVTVFARKTTVVYISKLEAEIFLEKNHIQGYASGSHYIGLKNVNDVLIAVLVLRKEGKGLNIIRYATSVTVAGGFTKLLKHAEKKYVPDFFVTFSDNCVSDGGLYKNNGFVFDKALPPDYMYVVKGERRHKFGYRLKRFRNDPELKFESGLTERELAVLNGLPRVYDAGKIRWVKKLK